MTLLVTCGTCDGRCFDAANNSCPECGGTGSVTATCSACAAELEPSDHDVCASCERVYEQKKDEQKVQDLAAKHVRQCATCERATLEHSWLCYDCGWIEPPHLLHLRVYGPLLPPVFPPHVQAVIDAAVDDHLGQAAMTAVNRAFAAGACR